MKEVKKKNTENYRAIQNVPKFQLLAVERKKEKNRDK